MSFSEWSELELGELCEYSSERIVVEDLDLNNYVSTENMLPNRKGVVVASKLPTAKTVVKYDIGDTLISNIRPYFKKIWYASKIGGSSNDVLVLKNTNTSELDNVYLYYYLCKDDFFEYVMGSAKGTKMPRGDKNAIMKYPINIPQLEEQKAIANILSTLDEKIEINNQINKNLEEMAQAIFKHWFVDFEFPNEEGEPYKSSGGEMVESELGLIPKGWEVKIIGDELETVLGGTPSRKKLDYWNNGNIAWINSGKVNEFRVLEASEFITEMGLKKSAAKMLPKRTTVIAITGATLGQISLLEIDTSANQSVVGIKENNRLKAEYIHPWMKFIIQELINMQTGGAQQHINKDNINKMNILIPHDRILNCYYDMVSPIFDLITKKEFEKVDLSKIRDALLPKLMSGEIRVPLESESDAS